MKKIPLSQGKFALVDDEDYEFINQWKWTAVRGKYTFYALRKTGRPKRINVHMHRLIIQAPLGMHVDHINRNGLDNRKSNLRLVNDRENMLNRKVLSTNTSGYPGVHRHTKNKTWIARVTLESGERLCLGSFHSLEGAIEARKEAEKKYYKF